jgi:predicted nucleic acid-binding protein
MPTVLDASAAVRLVFPDEPTPDGLIDIIAEGENVVPAIWLYEVANAVAIGRRVGRFDDDTAARIVAQFAALPSQVQPFAPSHVLDEVLPLALETGLTTYDAAYLALAVRRGLPLLTLDARLRDAARARGIEVLPV